MGRPAGWRSAALDADPLDDRVRHGRPRDRDLRRPERAQVLDGARERAQRLAAVRAANEVAEDALRLASAELAFEVVGQTLLGLGTRRHPGTQQHAHCPPHATTAHGNGIVRVPGPPGTAPIGGFADDAAGLPRREGDDQRSEVVRLAGQRRRGSPTTRQLLAGSSPSPMPAGVGSRRAFLPRRLGDTGRVHHHPTPLGALVRGIAAGVAGTAAMTAWQELSSRLRSSRANESEEAAGRAPQAEQQEQDLWENAPAPAVVGKRLIEGLFRRDFPAERISLLTHIAHWTYGAAWGGVYGLVQGTVRANPVVHGFLLGTGTWVTSYAQLVPMGCTSRRGRIRRGRSPWTSPTTWCTGSESPPPTKRSSERGLRAPRPPHQR